MSRTAELLRRYFYSYMNAVEYNTSMWAITAVNAVFTALGNASNMANSTVAPITTYTNTTATAGRVDFSMVNPLQIAFSNAGAFAPPRDTVVRWSAVIQGQGSPDTANAVTLIFGLSSDKTSST